MGAHRPGPQRGLALLAAGLVMCAAVAAGCSAALVPAAPSPAGAVTGQSEREAQRPTVGTTSGGLVRGERNGTLSRDRVARIALAGGVRIAPVTADDAWRIDESGGRVALVRGIGGEPWRVEQRVGSLRVAGDGGDATPWRSGPFVAASNAPDGVLRYGGHRYRGELWFIPTDSGILVVNRVPVEAYLRGVVGLELGTRAPSDRAALEAQTIAARSYAYARVPVARGSADDMPASGWHMTATVANQVYGGVDAEHPVVTAAVEATEGLVLRYGGLLVDAPYSSSCGGRTASPRDVWRGTRDEPYLQPVDDTDPATGRPFCDISPRNHWAEPFDEGALHAVVRRALIAAGAGNSADATVSELRVAERTVSGRVATFTVRTTRGDVSVRSSDLRTVFQNTRGAILPSTSFSVERETKDRGHLTGVTLRGAGNGHGVGMCQWGAIGRSRAGQDARTILRHYYPGTVVGFAD